MQPVHILGSVWFTLGISLLLQPALVLASPPPMTPRRSDVKPFEYTDAKVPFYPGAGRSGKPLTKMQLPLPAAESIKHFVHPVEFEIQLFAGDPDIKRPICMNWDERGRLWICESVDYPNELQPAGRGRDRIVICDDTDGDGKADQFTVFADKLSIPTSLTFAKGGVIVHQAPHTLFLRDNDGDGKADERRILFTGWGTGDTHAGPSNLVYGFDNWIYGIVGYSGFNGIVGGERHKFANGFYRFLPDGSKLEFLRNTNNNSWGVGFSEDGLLFGSTANGNPSVYLPIPNRYYERVRGWSSTVLAGIAGNPRMYPITDKVRQVDYHGRFTAAAGHALYTARRYPKEYWNRIAFVCEPTGHVVAAFELERKGADVVSQHEWNLLASDDEWSAPIMAEVGPDGCVWVIDWYNYIVQHNPTPAGFKTGRGNAYETPLRDKKHGRIYRLVPKKGPDFQPISLHNATPQKLVEMLTNDNLFWRRHAQRLLVERGQKDVVPELLQLVADPKVDAIGLNVGAIHALWTLSGLGAFDGSDPKALAALCEALKHPSAGVRRAAVAVLPRTRHGAEALLNAGTLHDDQAQVRLAALLAFSDMPPHPRLPLALLDLVRRNPSLDRWTLDACTCAAANNGPEFLKHLPGTKEFPQRLASMVTIVAGHVARGGDGQAAQAILAGLTAEEPVLTEAILTGAVRGWPIGKTVKLESGEEKHLARVYARLGPSGRSQLFTLAARWGSQALGQQGEQITSALLETLRNSKASDQDRSAAARQLIEFRPADDKLARAILEQLSPQLSPELAVGLITALEGSTAPDLGPRLVKRLPEWTPQMRSAAIRVLLRRSEGTKALLAGLDQGKVQMAELSLEQKQELASHPEPTIAELARKLLERGGSLPSADRQKVIDELLPWIKKTGDPAAGKRVFKKHCATCHVHAGEGNKIGPDLTGMAAHPKEELLVQIMDPSRSVEGNYRIYTVVTGGGKVLSGLLASETKTAIELIDTQAQKHILLREDIDQLTASNKSLMPDGFEKVITPEELVNLLEFLTQRGKFLPLPLEKAATVVSTRGMFYSEDATVERLIFPDWQPRTFEGIPFHLVDPRGDRVPNVIMLYGPQGKIPPKMPKAVKLPCHGSAKAIHFLSGISGWGYPATPSGTVSLIVRLHYADGQKEDHELKNGEHFADYIRRVDVPGSKFAFALRSQQVRYLAIQPRRDAVIREIELLKGNDRTAPVIMAVTVEGR